MKIKKISLWAVFLSALLSFNIFAMDNKNDNFLEKSSPFTEEKHEDRSRDYRWIWVSDDLCVRSWTFDGMDQADLFKRLDVGILSQWSDGKEAKKRDVYVGKWNQDVNGIWSFIFDDYTIPLGPTNIDGIIYAFNGYGQLVEGYNYWGDLATGPDGLVATDNQELSAWLETQYLPECMSHE